MKKIIFTVAAAVMALGANAQLLKSGLMDGYKEGDKLEKAVYTSREDVPQLDTWAQGFTSNPTTVPSPVVGRELSYPGYPEKGASIVLGTEPGVKGNHFAVYTIDTKKTYSKGVLYLACVVDMSKIGGSSPVDLVGLSATAVGASNRAAIKIFREGADRMRFATNILKSVSEAPMAYDYDTPHLVVLKIDYVAQTASLWIDPKTDAEPTEADCVAHGNEENVLKHAIRSISVRNRSGHQGNVGNIRLARTWGDLFAEN